MWTKLLIFGVASSLLTGIAGCTKITGVPEIRHAYINLTDKPVIIQSFWTNYPEKHKNLILFKQKILLQFKIHYTLTLLLKTKIPYL